MHTRLRWRLLREGQASLRRRDALLQRVGGPRRGVSPDATAMVGRVKHWPKLHRAIELRDELHRWSAESMGMIDYESRHNLQDFHDPLAWIEYRARPDTLPDGMRGAMLLGDMIHNFRAALDHQLWAVTPSAAKAGRNARRVQFPIHGTERSWASWAKEWRSVYGISVMAALADAQPCNVDSDGSHYHALGPLQALSNRDKHRELNVTAHVALGGYGFKIDPEPASGVRVTKHVGPIQGDSILARAEWDRAEDGGGRINVAPTLAYAQQVLVPDLDSDSDEAGEWHPLGDLVNAISSQVVLHVGKLYNADRVDRGLPQDQLT